MKPRMRFQNGYWWCRRGQLVGQGKTMKAAYYDMLRCAGANNLWRFARAGAP